jgi:hypothetical protein
MVKPKLALQTNLTPESGSQENVGIQSPRHQILVDIPAGDKTQKILLQETNETDTLELKQPNVANEQAKHLSTQVKTPNQPIGPTIVTNTQKYPVISKPPPDLITQVSKNSEPIPIRSPRPFWHALFCCCIRPIEPEIVVPPKPIAPV